MKNFYKCSVLCIFLLPLFYFSSQAQNVIGSAMNEVFKKTTLGTGLNDPWEVTFGPDGFLWITEAKGYVVVRMDTASGARDTVLNLSPTGTGFLTAAQHTLYNREAWTNPGGVPWPQGGMMGMALHPDFMHPTTPKKFVYIGYVADQGSVPTNNTGQYYTNFLVRFTFNTVSGNLESPVTLCDTLPGSKDHNSGRIIIAPIGGVNYLFYSSGDMGSGQYENLTRPVKVQNIGSYEGKILRFNLEEDGDAVQNAGVRSVNYNRWIPSGAGDAANPYNVTLGKQSAVWNIGHRNVQGLAIANFGGTDYIYGSSHGPYSDDEINILEAGKNYGHPLVIGDSTDGNYNNAKAGPSGGSLPFIANVDGEQLNARAMGTSYKNPIFNFYKVPKGSTTTCSSPNQYYIQDIYRNCSGTGTNNFWKSEAPSGMGIYTNTLIPGWKNSLLLASLKWGRVVRVKLNSAGNAIIPVNGAVDTMPYFKSQNRYRDMAISPDGRDIFIIMDKSTSTSGPSQANPSTLNCLGCVVKYRFLGYNDNAGTSSIPTSIPISPGVANQNTTGTIAVINADNNNIWVPITDSLGNIIAEIDANGNNLDTIRTILYKRSGTVRTTGTGKPYLDRSITINPKNQPTSNVNVRFYLTAAELASLVAAPVSGLSDINGINIFKNSDANGSVLTAALTPITTTRATFGSDYVVTGSIPSFSTFYFASSLSTLPVNLVTFTGSSINQATHLKWETDNEVNTASFVIERSIGGGSFEKIGDVAAKGTHAGLSKYFYTDNYSSYSPSEKLYYRLKMVDIDGEFKYSSIVTITPDLISGRVTIIPNPIVSTSEIKVNMTAPINGKVHWKLIDNNGRLIQQNVESLKKGSNNLMINVSRLPTGLYYMVVTGAGIDQKVKLQKL